VSKRRERRDRKALQDQHRCLTIIFDAQDFSLRDVIAVSRKSRRPTAPAIPVNCEKNCYFSQWTGIAELDYNVEVNSPSS
jgi:hypothetical protein